MFYETKHPLTSDYFKIEKGENYSFPPHIHRHFEFICLTEGEMVVTINNKEYNLKKGDGLLIFPNQIHSLSTTCSRHILCVFSPDLVKAFSNSVIGKIPLDNMFTVDPYYIHKLSNGEFDTISAKGFLYSICAEFNKSAKYLEESKESEGLLRKIFAFIDENYSKNCSLEDLANSTSYDYAYLSKYFKRIVGMPFSEYVNAYRVGDACYLLKNTDKSIIDISLECGYTSVRTFNRNFKDSFGLTPKEYRER